MTSLIIKSKIWNKSSTPLINYKDKNYLKQKITVERTGILSRRKDKIVFKQTENLNTSNNSSENTNYMNEPRTSELISIEKRENESSYYINCGDWPKDLIQLIDQNAVYFLYKGLTIENFLKEKQKYYVLNQGDIIKLGKIYLKILHIKLTGSNKKDDEDEKDKANATTDKEHSDMNKKVVSDSESNSDDNNSENNSENRENECESNIKNDIKKEEDEDKKSETIKRNYIQYNTNPNEYNKKNYKKENESNNFEYCAISNNFSYKRKNKKKSNNSKYIRLNRSFNGDLSDNNLDQLIKENINRNRSMSFTLKRNQFTMMKNSFYKINNNNLNESSKKKIKKKNIKDNRKKNKKEDKDKHDSPIKKEKTIINLKEREKDKDTIKPQEKKEKGKICRICLSGEDSPVKNPLICPCTCKGSMKFIHYFCLKNWLNLKIESDLGYGRDIETEQPTITYSTKDIACELCKTKLPDYIKHKGKIYNVSFYKPKYNKFIVLESIRDDTRRTKFIHIIPLNRRQIIKIGRLNNCDLSLPDFSISRVHCCMYIESGQLFLENNSKFGTKILVQIPKLVMSLQYPLCIEVQKTYLKLRIQKPFSLFSCCNVYTTSMTKMLVYQKQNEKGFDLFCSMVFKEDDGEEEEDDEIITNNINNNNKEEFENNENSKNENDKKEKINNRDNRSEVNKNLNISKKMTNKSEDGKKIEYKLDINLENETKEIDKKSELKDNRNNNEILNEKELIDNIENDKKDKYKFAKKIDEKITKIKENENKKSIKKGNLITKDKKCEQNNKNTIKKEETINNIINEIKEEKKNREKEDSKEISKEKNNEIFKDKKKVENMNSNHKEINIEKLNKSGIKEKDINLDNNKNTINSEYKINKSKTIQKDLEKKDIRDIIDSEFKINERRSIQKNEIKNNTKLIDTKFKNFEKKIMKNSDEKEKKEEKNNKKIKEEKNKETGKLLKKQYSMKNKEKKIDEIKINNELNRKETINNEINKNKEENKNKLEQEKNNNKINNLKIEEPKSNINKEKEFVNIEKEKEKEEEEKGKNQVKNGEKINKMKSESKKESKQNKKENEKKININFETDDKKYTSKDKQKISEYNKSIHSESYSYNTKRKFPNKSIDLNAINDLSYKQGEQEVLKKQNSPLDNYQSIFGLIPSKQNETSLLLAPRHTTNKNLKHFDLNINNEQMNETNKSNYSWNKYTSQYEENKRMKNI